jgi:pimeloyl-ACP methyl ester carboxylesterase
MIQYPLTVDGVQTRVLEAGVGAPKSAVFIHGVGARADRWRRNLEVFADHGYHAIAVDLPGHGFATKGAGFRYEVPAYADFIRALLERLELARPILIGTSMGGHIAATVAVREPSSLSALVLIGTVGIVPVGEEIRRSVQRNLGNTTLEGIRGKFEWLLVDHGLITDEWVREEHFINNSEGGTEAMARLGEYWGTKLDDDAVGESLAATDLPIHLVWGAQDKAVPVAQSSQCHQLLSGSTLTLIPKSGHQPYFEQAEIFNQRVLDLLAPVRAGKAG